MRSALAVVKAGSEQALNVGVFVQHDGICGRNLEERRDLVISKLRRSITSAKLAPVMRASLTAFLHRGLSPHQFTPMSGTHPSVQRTGTSPCDHTISGNQWRLVPTADSGRVGRLRGFSGFSSLQHVTEKGNFHL